ncbi:MAG: hypothetical protein US45_C0004G0017 [Candidatus Nomurabacteria bacterium GW2011_GWA1_37_20]|uniref:Uncharacterized protein n=1 Tax=Candidatus Nomurabacteria bacterium GW2011_GWA1_37_20 TaxID=1618729 RepID=A0A0G0JZQ1_9BACT|nr:MAG: hypothetical protein US33_C0003G0009 [Parcubacteria group bacterium GW2011_GWC1_36_9]KKQ28535.1 MAG: hypothetical protein US41_C0002G0005 [Parcubacteria group bacterium GW2011_GWB1_37_13]KKQ33856.1 MAG: hypothetical protein US45_C0004G0017 [Candidatus Nomurabacteria bacterium GW2011_GWA1_37_20]
MGSYSITNFMSKRNFILLIIILGLIVIAVFGLLYFQQKITAPKEDEGSGTNFISQFNPFGAKPTPPAVTLSTDASEYQSDTGETQKIKLVKVSSMPVAGFTVFTKERLKEAPMVASAAPSADTEVENAVKKTTPAKKLIQPLTEFALALRYVDKAIGNIYQTFVDKIEEQKFSKTVIPKVYDSYFGNRGESVVMRYLKEDEKTIETFVGALPKELLGKDTTTENEIKGSFLPDNIKDISVSPDGLKIFYLFISGNNLENSMVGATLNLLNNKKVQVFDSTFTEWLSFWPTKNTITLTTKPSARVPGYMYSIDGAGKNLIKILGGINGLTTLESLSGKLILYGDNNLSLYVYHTDSRNSDVLGIKTLPEKCIWGKISDIIYCAAPKSIESGEYPDAWYQGEVSFNDQFWKIDIKTGNATLMLDPISIERGEEIDGIKLTLDEGENYLFFINKKDSFLWKLDLK